MAKFTAEAASAAGKKGGQTTVERYGTQHMAAIGKLGFQATVDKHWRGDRTRYLTYLQVKGDCNRSVPGKRCMAAPYSDA